jgi:hypothetical protein
MATTDQITLQSNIKTHTKDDLTKYALFLGGTNVAHEVLQCYDPLRTGYGRLFMVRKPVFLIDDKMGISNKFNKFKHILEYGNTAIQGLTDVSVNFAQIQGGYNAKSFEIPTSAQDNSNTFTVQVYEFSGSPVREVITHWINGTTDLLTGLTHYNGAETEKLQANNTAEFIYVATDNTGQNIEYACFLANCFPGGINTDAFNYTSGEHNLVQTDIEFHCTKYESLQINKVAEKLLKKYRIVTNSLNFHSGIGTEAKGLGYGNAQDFNVQKGILEQTDNETLDEYKISYNEYGTNYNHGEPLMFNSYSGHTRLV